MSQFSQKYYKHYITKKEDIVEERSYYSWFTTDSLTNTILKWLLILLLFALLLFLLKQLLNCNSFSSSPSLSLQSTQVKTTAVGPIQQEEKPQEENSQEEKSQEDQSLEKTLQEEYTYYTLEEKIPIHVLPELSKIIPKEEVTLEQYMYYVNDTKEGYPDYVDPATNRIIKEKKPKCEKLDCPVTHITQTDKINYTQWLSELSQSKYKFTDSQNGFRVVEE